MADDIGTGLENPETLLRNWKAELDAQYKRGRHFAMVLHPHAIGWPSRLLAYINVAPPDDGLASSAAPIPDYKLLVCPSDLAYGDQGRPGIPGGAALTFEIELLDIVTK